MVYKLGVDGGGSKTETILVDPEGTIVARQVAAGCNPNVVGPELARRTISDALAAVMQEAFGNLQAPIESTHLYVAGSRSTWREAASAFTGVGRVIVGDDSEPVLELATGGRPGLVLHAGTGSFVAARAPDGSIHYAGGTGWRFGDPGSGYDLGRRAIGRALLELQGWRPASRLTALVREHAQLGPAADAGAITRHFYQHPEPNRQIAALAPALLRLASEGDHTAHQLVLESTAELLALAVVVAEKLFPAGKLNRVPAGLSGPILTHPVVVTALASRTPLGLTPVEGTPIEGVRRLLLREGL